jgi:hypothetical protein
VRAQPIPSGPKIKPNLLAEILEAITLEALSLAQTSLIGIAPTKHPLRTKLQDWVNVNLVDASMLVTRIRMLPRDYFVLTFATEEGAAGALHMSPLNFGTHSLYLHPWSPQFDPTKPKGIRIPIWIKFPKLDDLYYKALLDLCSQIGEVVWFGKQDDYLSKSSTPRVCVLVEDVRQLPSALILPIPLIGEEVEIILEYEGIPSQCSKCLGLDHEDGGFRNTPQKNQKTTGGAKPAKSLPGNKPETSHRKTSVPSANKRGEQSHTRAPGDEGSRSTGQTGAEHRTKPVAGPWPKLQSQKQKDNNIWQVVDMKGNTVNTPTQTPSKPVARQMEPFCTPNSLPNRQLHTPSKKRASPSSNLDDNLWRLLDFSNTPRKGIRRMFMWLVITTTGVDNRKLFLSYLQGDLHPTKVSLVA